MKGFKGDTVVRKNLYNFIIISLSFAANFSFVACGDDDSDKFFNKSAWEEAFEKNDEDGSSSSWDEDCEDDECSSSSLAGSSSSSGGSSGSDSSKSSSSGAGSCSSKGNDASSSSVPKDTIKVGFNEKFNVSVSVDSAEDYYTNYTYKTVQIGAYEWMAENLRTTGNISYCYDSDSTNCDIYGRLYYTTVPECPRGFNLPTKEQWEELFAIAKGTAALKSKSYWQKGKAAAGTDELGFNALPAGSGYYGGKYSGLGSEAKFMIAFGDGYYSFTNDSDEPIYDSEYESKKYVSIRCVKRADEVASEKEMPAKCNRGETIIAAAKKFACKDTAWVRSISNMNDTCYANEELMLGMYGSNAVVCKSGHWYKVTGLEDSLGYCDAKHAGDTATYKGTLYGCNDFNWHKAGIGDVYGKCLEHETTKPVTYDGVDYICMDSTWKKISALDNLLGLCTDKMDGFIASGENGTEYICLNHTWKTPTKNDILGTCGSNNYGEIKEALGSKYVCKSNWTTPSTLESRYGACTESRAGEIIDSSYSFICKAKEWTKATVSEMLGTCNSSNNLESKKVNGSLYVCRNNTWGSATAVEKENGVCTKAKEGTISESGYVCENLEWHKITAMDVYGKCTAALQDTVFGEELCDNGKWRGMSNAELIMGAFCIPKNAGKIVRNGTYYEECNGNGWIGLDKKQYELGGTCKESLLGKIGTYNDTLYECEFSQFGEYYWYNTHENAKLGPCNEETTGTTGKYNNVTYICKRSTITSEHFLWSNAKTDYETAIGYCTRDKFKSLKLYDDVLMYCDQGLWEKATRYNYLGYCMPEEKGLTKTFYNQEYTCDGKGMGWMPVYGSFTDTRDGHVYRTVGIGNRVWLADNLTYETNDSWCVNGNANGCDNLGRFYTYAAAKNACPEGWSLPDAVKDDFSIGLANMRSMDTWQTDGFDQAMYSDLDVKASGIRRNGGINYDHRAGGFWMANEVTKGSTALTQCIQHATAAQGACPKTSFSEVSSQYLSEFNESDGFPVRCVKADE